MLTVLKPPMLRRAALEAVRRLYDEQGLVWLRRSGDPCGVVAAMRRLQP